jgi:hypothetical protein
LPKHPTHHRGGANCQRAAQRVLLFWGSSEKENYNVYRYEATAGVGMSKGEKGKRKLIT